MNTPTPEELADDIEALLLKFCPGGRTQEAGVALLALARSAVAAEREACRKEYEEIHGTPMRQVALLLAGKWFRPEDWRDPHEGMRRP